MCIMRRSAPHGVSFVSSRAAPLPRRSFERRVQVVAYYSRNLYTPPLADRPMVLRRLPKPASGSCREAQSHRRLHSLSSRRRMNQSGLSHHASFFLFFILPPLALAVYERQSGRLITGSHVFLGKGSKLLGDRFLASSGS